MSYVYRHLDATGQLLYIGCSCYLRDRHYLHRKRSPWWSDVAEVTVEGPFDAGDAYDYEADLISHFQPPHNIEGTQRDTRPGFAKRFRTDPNLTPPPIAERRPTFDADLTFITERLLSVSAAAS